MMLWSELTPAFLGGVDTIVYHVKNPRPRRYNGNWLEICRKVVDDCWTGNCFTATSYVELQQFWIRDFSWCVEGLIYLGHHDRVRRNLEWVLDRYASSGRVTTTVSVSGHAFDIFEMGSDSLPMLLSALLESGNVDLAKKHKAFLNSQIAIYFERVFDPGTRLIRNVRFSEPKDTLLRKRTCVGNTFMIFLKNLLVELPFLDNLFKSVDLEKPFVDAFWTGEYFQNDLGTGGNFVSSDANVWPYWTGVVKNEKMEEQSIQAIKKGNLDFPFPIKYQGRYESSWEQPWVTLFKPNYAGNSVWTLHGPIYIAMESKFFPDEAKKHLEKYQRLVEEYGTYVEVFEPDGQKPLSGRFGILAGAKGMLWAAMLPVLAKQLDN